MTNFYDEPYEGPPEPKTPINYSVIERWAKRLEENKDPQDTGYLRTDQGLCCLGVLCEIAVEDGIIEKEAPYAPDGVWRYDGHTTILPPKVAEWAFGDSTQSNPMLNDPEDEDGGRYEASEYNDAFGYTFPRIAAAVRKTYGI